MALKPKQPNCVQRDVAIAGKAALREGVTTNLVAIVVQHTKLDITQQLHALHRCSSGRHLVAVSPVMHAEHLTVAYNGCVLDAYFFRQLCVSCQKRILAVDWQEVLGFY